MSKKKDDPPVITLSNEKIISFFSKNKNLNIEQTFISFIDIIDRLSESLKGSIDNSLITNILQRMQSIETNVSTINGNLQALPKDILSNISTKMNESRKEFIDQLKLNLTSNVSTEITPLIKEYSDHLFERTSNIIRDTVPKNNDSFSQLLSGFQRDICSSIERDTEKLMSSSINNSSLGDFLSKIENNLSLSQKDLESKIQNNLSSTSQILGNTQLSIEQKIENQRNDSRTDYSALREICESNKSRNEETNSQTSEILKKLGNSSDKGTMGEHLLLNVITPLYPCADINHVGNTEAHSGDIIMIRDNDKPKIIIENKCYESQSIPTKEVIKFISDVKRHKCCGIFVSQHTGVALKENWEINVEDGHVVIYLHEVNNNPDIIKNAVSIIDSQQKFYDSQKINGETELSISKEDLDLIYLQFREFTSKKMEIIKKKEENHRVEKKMIEELLQSQLATYFKNVGGYEYQDSKEHICQYCHRANKNKAGLASHLKGCLKKKEHELANKPQSSSKEVEISIDA